MNAKTINELFNGEDSKEDELNQEIGTIFENIGTEDKIRVTIHRITEDGKEPQVDLFTNVDVNNIPSTHEIGLKHGGGAYRAWIRYPDKSKKQGFALKKKVFHLDDSYNLEKEKYLAMEHAKLQTPSGNTSSLSELVSISKMLAPNQKDNTGAIIGMMQESNKQTMTMFMTMMQNMTAMIVGLNSKQSERDPMTEMLFKTVLTRQDNLLDAQLEGAKKGMDMFKELAQPENKNEWLDFANTLVENASAILSPLASKSMIQKRLQNEPQALAILENDEKLKTTIEMVVQKYPENEARKILEKMELLERAYEFGILVPNGSTTETTGLKVG